MKLEQFSGVATGVKLAISGCVQLVQTQDGKWYGLNNRSCDPCQLGSKSWRSEWARMQGLKPRDVENYVRKETARQLNADLAEDVENARLLLFFKGYTITPPAGAK